MVPLAALALWSCAPVRPLDAADRRALEHVISAVTQFEYERNTRDFTRAAPKTLIPTWRRLQSRLAPNERGYPSVAFALAFYQVDYARNIERLLAQYRIARRAYDADQEPALPPRYGEAEELLPNDLYILFERFHDPVSLGRLMDLRTDGAMAENQSWWLHDIWTSRPTATLLAANKSPVRLERLADTINYEANPAYAADKFRHDHATLARLMRSRDRRVAHTSRAVQERLVRLDSHWR